MPESRIDDALDRYAYWRRELAQPGSQRRENITEPVDGFWRMAGAKTKADYPVAIWASFVKIGRKEPFDKTEHALDYSLFFETGGWLHCRAVTEAEYHRAMDTGYWDDGKKTRLLDFSNEPPDDEALKDQIEAAVESAKSFDKIETQEDADRAATVYDTLRKLWKEGDTQRDKEKRPHDEAAAAVQTKWLPIIEPAATASAALNQKIKDFLKREFAKHAAAAQYESVDQPVQARPKFGRAQSLRTVRRGRITDQAKFIRAVSKGEDFQSWLQTKANALARANTKVAGMEIEESKE